MAAEKIDIPIIIGGREIRTGERDEVGDAARSRPRARRVPPRRRRSTSQQAIAAAAAARREWAAWPWEDRAAVLLRAAELLATTWRATINAATMLGQSKTAFQSEIDAACEMIDFWRFNALLRAGALRASSRSAAPACGTRWSTATLEGFVYAVSPFNFTAIGGNLTDRAGADGQHRRSGSRRTTRDAERYYTYKRARGRGPAAGRHQLPARRRRRRSPTRCSTRRELGRHPLHRQHRRLQQHVEEGRREHGPLPHLSAPGRRNRRQGLHRRAPVGRPAGGRRRDRARRRSSTRGRSARPRAASTCRSRCGTRSAIAPSR